MTNVCANYTKEEVPLVVHTSNIVQRVRRVNNAPDVFVKTNNQLIEK